MLHSAQGEGATFLFYSFFSWFPLIKGYTLQVNGQLHHWDLSQFMVLNTMGDLRSGCPYIIYISSTLWERYIFWTVEKPEFKVNPTAAMSSDDSWNFHKVVISGVRLHTHLRIDKVCVHDLEINGEIEALRHLAFRMENPGCDLVCTMLIGSEMEGTLRYTSVWFLSRY